MENEGYLISFPRSGCTWIRYILACVLCGRIIEREKLSVLFPDLHRLELYDPSQKMPFVLYKSHFSHYKDYEDKKIIYLYRDGRDVALSYYYFKYFEGTEKAFSQYLKDEFISIGIKRYGGTWKEHVESWAFKKDKKIFIINYEELYANTFQVIRNVVTFLRLNTTDDWIQEIIKFTNINYWRKISRKAGWYDKQIGLKGEPGGWKKEFSQSDLDLFWNWAGDLMKELNYKYGGIK